MDNKATLRLVGILLINAVFALIAKMLEPSWILTRIPNLAGLRPLLQGNALMVVAVAFTCTLVWFVVGEWAIQAWAPARTWYLTWTLLFLVVVLAAIYYSILDRPLTHFISTNYNVLACYLAIAILPFYLSTLLFTPTNGRYVIWPSEHIVKW